MKDRLKQALSQDLAPPITDSSRTPAAVLVPIYDRSGEYYILFTRRTHKVMTHKGEISFPGGTVEDEDCGLVDTAIRECEEEIGLKADDIEILGRLDDMTTVTSGYIITPFVGFIPYPYQFVVNEEEIDEIIEIPIRELLDREVHSVTGYSYQHQGRTIWGATARILEQFLDIFTRVM